MGTSEITGEGNFGGQGRRDRALSPLPGGVEGSGWRSCWVWLTHLCLSPVTLQVGALTHKLGQVPIRGTSPWAEGTRAEEEGVASPGTDETL